LTEAGESIPSGDAGASLVTAHEDGSVRWWRADASSGTLAAFAVLDTADPAPAGLTFVGGTVALAASDGSVWLQDTASDGPSRRIGRHGAAVRTIASAPGGWPLATGADDGTVRLWTGPDGGSRLFVGPTSAVRSVVLAPRHDLILAGASDGSIWRWLLRDGTRLPPLRDGASAVTALAVDGQAVFAGRKDGSVRRYALDRTVAPTDLFSGQGATTGLLLAPLGADGSALVGGFAASPIQRSDLRTGGELGALAGPPATALAATSAGDVLASVSADGTLRLWQSADGRLLTELPAHTLPGVGVAFGPDGRMLATVGMDGTLALWTVR
jgi:WD40 repeat protein